MIGEPVLKVTQTHNYSMKIEVGENNGQSGPVNRPERIANTFRRTHCEWYLPTERANSSNSSGNGGCDIWSRIKCCFCFWFILPIILIVVGMMIVGAKNSRVQRITE